MQRSLRLCVSRSTRITSLFSLQGTRSSPSVQRISSFMSSKEGEKSASGGDASKTMSASSQSVRTSNAGTGNSEPNRSPGEDSGSKTYMTRDKLQNEHKKEVDQEREKFLSMDLDSKRKLYKCKNKFTTLDSIETWPQHYAKVLQNDQKYQKYWNVNKRRVNYGIREDLNQKMSLFRGDITTLEIDAIVNAANESLLGGGGVDGAIHSAAGPLLRSECETLNGCEPGGAKISCGYKLPAKYVIHTVGPRGEKPAVLEKSYKQSLKLLKKNNLKSVAFPCISTGIFGYPNVNAAKVALTTIRDWLENDEYAKNVDRIIMCLFLQIDVDVYNEQMMLHFPVSQTSDSNENQQSDPECQENEKEEKGKKKDAKKSEVKTEDR